MHDKRHIHTFLLLILLSISKIATLQAQAFTHLDWTMLRIDSLLPYYTEVIPLESDYRSNSYSVKVLYPEWEPLTRQEEAVAKRFKEQIADSLVIESEIGISRGEGMLDVRFIPIIRQGKHYVKLLSGKIEIKAHLLKKTPQSSLRKTTQPRWKTHSALASGKWVKISLTTDGIYHLTNAQLTAMGFSNPSNIIVMGYGGHRQKELIQADTDWDDLDAVSILPVSDGYLFHANGLLTWQSGQHAINHYANAACYFITEATTAHSFPTESNTLPTQPNYISSVSDYAVHDPQEYSWYQGGRTFFENYDYANGNSRTYTLNLPAYPATQKGTLSIAFSAANDENTKITPTLNGTALNAFTITKLSDSYSSAVLKTQIYTPKNLQQSNTLTITTTSGRHARLNYFKIDYTAALKIDASKPYIQFNYANEDNNNVLRLEYAVGQQPLLWRVGADRIPTTALEGTLQDQTDEQGITHHYYLVPLKDSGEHTYVAFDANVYSQYPQPTTVGNIANQDLHSVGALDMVIITPANGLYNAQAQRLANAHAQYDSLRVGVLQADQIYNEFSSGTPDATAYRRFMKMIYDRCSNKKDAPRYLLLFGDGLWDNRMITSECKSNDPNNYLLTYESENSISDILCYVMEDYFGLLDDGEGSKLTSEKIDLGIGRFPVTSVTQAQLLVDKTIKYIEQNESGKWRNIICFMGDDGDNNEHMRYADAVAKNVAKQHPELELRKIMWDAYKREGDAAGYRYPKVTAAIQQQMEEGAIMMNYTGHGATYTLSHEHVLTLEHFRAFNAPRPPLWVTAACDVMPFDGLKENIGETAVLHETGSAIAFYGTTRTVYAYNNLLINDAFCNNVFNKDIYGRAYSIGDAVRYSKVNIIEAGSELGNLQNKLHYVLLGDPALTIGNHYRTLIIDSINHVAVEQSDTLPMLHAGGKAHFSGHVAQTDGTTDTHYNGIVHSSLFDSESTITCLNNAQASTVFTFTTYNKTLYSSQDSILDGQFSFTSPLPLDIKYSNEQGRLVLYATSNSKRVVANGFSHDFNIGGTEPSLTDSVGPIIHSYLDTEDFQDGGIVGTTPYFVAQLRDESGINTSGNGIGHDLELIIDNQPATTYNLNNYYSHLFGDYTQGTVAYSIPALSAGIHTLTFRAWDMLNNSNSESYSFYVDPSKSVNVVRLTASCSPATTSTNFLLYFDRPGSICDYTIEVFDFAGRYMWSTSGSGSNSQGLFTIPWNLTSGGGMPLHSGIYLYRAKISCNGVETITKAQKLIINRRQ